MELIESFKIDHLRLLPGIYVSRRDGVGKETLTTFDLRVTAPNREPVMDQPALHTLEHLGATFLRNSGRKDDIVYFGPMGCRTGFYLIMAGDISPEEIEPLIKEMLEYVRNFTGDIPGATAEQCGNYLEQNLAMAKYYAARYEKELEERRFTYPS